jgi:hypothetical protein
MVVSDQCGLTMRRLPSGQKANKATHPTPNEAANPTRRVVRNLVA